MEFPTDIWREIFAFIPQPYREPSHHKALMSVESFRERVGVIQDPSARCEVESFYMHLVLSSSWYWAYPDIQHLMIAPEVMFRRGVAEGVIKDEFIGIYDKYSLNHLHYEIT